eukprot:Phypoly_transcript_04061.p1 GENE.Phypoly_transcript_04061~~Phypoly_transcript_04061.p1  ORF type:complete len:662 (+),score=188.83 Phypoly_transcript_04061:146-2131(+)
MAANKAQDERNTKILRQLSLEPDNKKCMDCGIKGTVYVCSNFNTFICTACSGLHREFNHRVKSISMTIFKPEEIKNLQQGGNAVARRKWLARWTPEDFPEPDPSDAQRVKAFMKLKYIDKRWYSETGEGPQNHSSSSSSSSNSSISSNYPSSSSSSRPDNKSKQQQHDYPQPVPLTTILGNDIPPLHINGSNKPPTAAPPVHTQPPASQNNAQNLVDWNATNTSKASAHSDLDDLLSIPSTAQQQQYQQQLQQQQHQNTYQQQQQLIMQQFGAHSQGAWGQPAAQAFYPPYGFGQQPGFYGVTTPPNFFTPPPAQPPNPYSTPVATGAISPTFGQPTGGHSTGAPYSGLSPSPTPLSQPNTYGGLSPTPVQQGFGATLSPAQPPNAFGGSPALHAGVGGLGGFTQSPSLHSTQTGFGGQSTLSPAPAPVAQPPTDKFDIFASLSPLNAANSSSTAKPPSSFPVASHAPPSHSSFPPANSSSNPSTSHSNNPNPFGDPFGSANASQPPHSLSQPTHTPVSNNNMNNSDLFGGFGGTPSPALAAKPAQLNNVTHINNNSDPFGGFGSTASPSLGSGGFGGAPNPAKPANGNNSDPFGFGGPTPTSSSQQHSNNANPFGDNPFGGAPAQPPAQPPSAFSPYNQNPFGQQQQQQQQTDPFANPFF